MQKKEKSEVIASKPFGWKTVLSLVSSLIVMTQVALPVSAFAAQDTTFIRDATPNYRTDEIPVIRSDAPLFNFVPEGHAGQMKLTGIYPERNFRFYSPKDEIISKASVTIKYTPSPSLIPVQSQLNVYLNGQLQKTLPITKEQLGAAVSQTVDLNPKNIEESNRLTLEFVGVYTTVCGNVSNPSLWLTVDESSYISINTQKLRLANDLSLLPTPFINTLSPEATTLPVLFTENPSDKVKQAAGVFASWVGTKTEWRGADFPVYIKEIPADQNFVVFATNKDRPEFLKKLPDFDAPVVAVIDAPNSLSSKVLVIGGRNEDDLLAAAQWLATGAQALTGNIAKVSEFKPLPDRQAYDAPNWINTNEKVSFDRIAKYKGQLSSSGIHPAPIALELKLPPDLFMVNRSNVKLDLKYRYTKPTTGEVGQMRFMINDQLVNSFDLDPQKNTNSFTSQYSLLNGLSNLWNNTSIPSRLLSADNILQFDFQYALAVNGGSAENCKSVAIIPNHVEIDSGSTIDFSDFYHFAKLPDLNLFTVSGFPFTKYADLSGTGVLIAQNASASLLTSYLNTMARLSAQTGYPATKVTVYSKADAKQLASKDVLAFAESLQNLDGLAKSDGVLALTQLKSKLKGTFVKADDAAKQADSVVAEDVGVAAIVQYQSPYDSERSVVALFGDGQDGSYLLNRHLMNPGDLKLIKGSVAVFKTNAAPVSYDVGEAYYSGSLPWHQRIWYAMLDQPLLLVLFTVVCALLLAGIIYYMMRSLIRFRRGRHQ